jgi:hypothetical protein
LEGFLWIVEKVRFCSCFFFVIVLEVLYYVWVVESVYFFSLFVDLFIVSFFVFVLCLFYLFIFWLDSLKDFFGKFGEIADCVVMRNVRTGQSKGCGFVLFVDEKSAEKTLVGCPHQLNGRAVSFGEVMSIFDRLFEKVEICNLLLLKICFEVEEKSEYCGRKERW